MDHTCKASWFPLLFQLVTIRISSINSYSTSLLLSTNLVILQCGGEHSPANNKSHQLVTSQTYIALILRALPLELFFLQQSHDPRSEELLGLAGGSVAPPVSRVELHLAGLDEILDAAHVVLADGEMEGGPVVVVRGVHVHTGEVESLQGHFVSSGGGV